jgi:hypothetical protein
MEYLENEESKGIYWILFFLIIIVITIGGYYFVFEKGVSKKHNEIDVKKEEETDSLDKYIGAWKSKDSDDDEVIKDYEVDIIKIDGATLIFDLKVSDELLFPNQFGDLVDNKASFEINTDEYKISGDITLKDNSVYLSILSSSDDELITIGTFRLDNQE